MSQAIEQLLAKICSTPECIEFNDVISAINEHYDYHSTSFTNGLGEYKLVNEAGQNEGSCRIFAFAKLQKLSEAQTLACFGKYYREDVLKHPHGVDHANIRTFMQYGWKGICFDGEALKPKAG